jgi:OOP family OmpA-OmpF porin
MKTISIYTISLFLTFLLVGPISAQIDVKGKIRDKVLQRADQHVDEGIDKGLDAAEEGVKDAATEDENKGNEEQGNKEVEKNNDTGTKKPTSNSGQQVSQNAGSQENTPAPGLSTYSKYDFIPGDKIFFYEDFTQDAVGDFPALWNTDGSGEVISTNLYPGNWFKMKPGGVFMPEITIPFNENFTFECDLIFKDVPTSSSSEGFDINLIAASPEWKIGDNFSDGCTINLNGANAWAGSWKDGIEFFSSAQQKYDIADMTIKIRVSVWVQKQRMRLYINEVKVLDLPRLLPPGLTYNKLEFVSSSYEGNNSLMTNVRIAYGAPDTRNKFMTEGKLVTHGILFDINSDKIKPESYGTLKDIAAILKENATVKVKIIGHTDSDGDDAKNLDLSKRRSVSVKNELSKSFGIEASRIETDGKGETQPIAPNDSPSNKAQNRRVEFIKL